MAMVKVMVFNATYNNISVISWLDKIYVLYENKYSFSAVDILLQSNTYP